MIKQKNSNNDDCYENNSFLTGNRVEVESIKGI